MKLKSLLLIILTLMLFGCKTKNNIPAVESFEATRYLGLWYEIARLPNSFEEGLEAITAEYQLSDKGGLKVINSGTTQDGKRKQSEGKAKFIGAKDVALLKVTFFWPFYGEYKVIHLEEDYSTAIVTSKGYEFLWILHRSKSMDKDQIEVLIQKCKDWGYDTSQLIFPKH